MYDTHTATYLSFISHLPFPLTCLFAPTTMSPERTNLDHFDTDGLVRALADLIGNSVPRSDVKTMRKSNITGYNLARSGTQEVFERLGMSWGTASNLILMKNSYLGLKR